MAKIIRIAGGESRRRAFWRQRKWLMIAVAAVVLIAGGAGAYFWYASREAPADEVTLEEKRAKALAATSKVREQIRESVEAEDKAAVERAYDEHIEQTSEPYEKATLYYNKASTLDGMGDRQAAFDAALAATKADTEQELGVAPYSLVANAAYDLGKKDVALEYYKKVRDIIKNDGYYDLGNPLPSIEERIAELEGELQ